MRPHGKGQRPKPLSFALGNIEGLFHNQRFSFCADRNIFDFAAYIFFDVFNIITGTLGKFGI